MALPFYTIGHSTRPLEAFLALLQVAGVTCVADIRSLPGSRANPQYDKAALSARLADHGFGYAHIAELGGLRGRSEAVPPDINGFWDNRRFHDYADHALTDGFRAGLERLLSLGRSARCAVMCSEAVWWRCHRRIVADHLLARGERVYHLMGGDRIDPAGLTRGARVGPDGRVTYPVEPSTTT